MQQGATGEYTLVYIHKYIMYMLHALRTFLFCRPLDLRSKLYVRTCMYRLALDAIIITELGELW